WLHKRRWPGREPVLPRQSELDGLTRKGWKCRRYGDGYARCLCDRACGTLDVLQLGVLGLPQRDVGGLAGGSVIISAHSHVGDRRRREQLSGSGARVLGVPAAARELLEDTSSKQQAASALMP